MNNAPTPTPAPTLVVPATCRAGHHLEPRTTNVRHTGADAARSGQTPTGWECVICVRVECWTAQFPSGAVPAELFEPETYKRQREVLGRSRMPRFTKLVHFESGWQFAEPDPTPQQRTDRRQAAEDTKRKAAAERERRERDAADRRERENRRREAAASLSRIRGLMGAAS